MPYHDYMYTMDANSSGSFPWQQPYHEYDNQRNPQDSKLPDPLDGYERLHLALIQRRRELEERAAAERAEDERRNLSLNAALKAFQEQVSRNIADLGEVEAKANSKPAAKKPSSKPNEPAAPAGRKLVFD
jgi:hypothetical protein